MVGVQCKSCGHRALATPEPFKMDHEIIALLSQSSPKCSECGSGEFAMLRFPARMADAFLEGEQIKSSNQE